MPKQWLAKYRGRCVATAASELELMRMVCEELDLDWRDVDVYEGEECRKLPGDDGTAEPPKPQPMPASQMSAAALESGAATESPAMTIGEEVAARMVPEPQNDEPGRVAVMPIDGKGSWVAFTRASPKYALHTRQRLRQMIADAINAHADRDAPSPTQSQSPIGELVRNFRMPPQPEPGPVKGGWDFESPKPQLAPLDIFAGQAMAAFIGREALQIAHFSDEQAEQLAAAAYRMARAMARHSAICNRNPVDAFSDEKGSGSRYEPQNAANSP